MSISHLSSFFGCLSSYFVTGTDESRTPTLLGATRFQKHCAFISRSGLGKTKATQLTFRASPDQVRISFYPGCWVGGIEGQILALTGRQTEGFNFARAALICVVRSLGRIEGRRRQGLDGGLITRRQHEPSHGACRTRRFPYIIDDLAHTCYICMTIMPWPASPSPAIKDAKRKPLALSARLPVERDNTCSLAGRLTAQQYDEVISTHNQEAPIGCSRVDYVDRETGFLVSGGVNVTLQIYELLRLT
ncbi:hypothetical protein K449DRAFT_465320 [Hypoxylon sp. EC38]|nr:hypothetical protein K449DRAFT_465320 [Hypoxylon sp. EC38]